MKLTNSHIFLILLAVLLLPDLGFKVREGLEESGDFEATKEINLDETGFGDVTSSSEENLPSADSDKWALKSTIIPPVCPKCPDVKACPRQKECPPCPACARCPESAFTCKKVPDYDAINTQQMPKPILNDFSSFSS